jgi:hypothetical protein
MMLILIGNLAEILFNTFVRGPATADVLGDQPQYPIARYDIDLDSYHYSSWIGLSNGRLQVAFVRLLSTSESFDTIQVVAIDPITFESGERRSIPWQAEGWKLVRNSPSGITECRQIKSND